MPGCLHGCLLPIVFLITEISDWPNWLLEQRNSRFKKRFIPKSSGLAVNFPPCSKTSNHLHDNTTSRTHACTVHSLERVSGGGAGGGGRGVRPEFQDPTMISMMWSSSLRSERQLEVELSGVGPWEDRLSSRS